MLYVFFFLYCRKCHQVHQQDVVVNHATQTDGAAYVCSVYFFLLLPFDHRKPHQTIKVQENSKFEMRTLEYAILYTG